MTDSEGWISRQKFMKYTIEHKLLDFHDKRVDENPRTWVSLGHILSLLSGVWDILHSLKFETPSVILLGVQSCSGPFLCLTCCCCCSHTRVSPQPVEMDRVERAFRRMDLDGDGFLDFDEFCKVRSCLS